MLAIMT